MQRRDSIKSLVSLAATACAGGTFFGSQAALAATETFPSRPIKMIVPYPPGGNADFLGRLVGDHMAKALNTSVIVDNKPGANAHIGLQALLREPADGHAVMISGVNSMVTNLLALPNAGYEPFRDIQLLTVLVNTPLVFVVPADSPIKTFDDFLKTARAKPATLSYGTWGTGSSVHLEMEALSELAGLQLNHIPYKGSAAALPDLVSGRLDMMLDLPQSSLPHIRSGKLRALAMTSTTPAPGLPDVEPIAKWVPGYTFNMWNGIYARAGMPPEAKTRLQGAIAAALVDPVGSRRLADSGNVPQPPLTDEQIMQMLRSEDKRLRAIVAKRKIQFG